MFSFFAQKPDDDNNEAMLAASEFFKMVKLLKIYPVGYFSMFSKLRSYRIWYRLGKCLRL